MLQTSEQGLTGDATLSQGRYSFMLSTDSRSLTLCCRQGMRGPHKLYDPGPLVLVITVMLLLQAHLESRGQAVIPLHSVVPPHPYSAIRGACHQEPVLQLVELVQEAH